jgi:hypothetical protein
MRVSKYLVPLFLIGVVGCLHRSVEDRVLAAFSREGPQILAGDSVPQYVRFRDDRSARVFSGLARNGIQVAPEGSVMLCPGVPQNGLHGYAIEARVDEITGETAFGTLTSWCSWAIQKCPQGQVCVSMGGNSIQYSTKYLVSRRSGEWKVVRPLFGSASLM